MNDIYPFTVKCGSLFLPHSILMPPDHAEYPLLEFETPAVFSGTLLGVLFLEQCQLS